MKTEALALSTHGGPDVLVRQTIEIGDLGPRDVRVRVRAVALNHLDLWVRRGLPNLKLTYPHCLGSDVAGEVDAVGLSARGVAVGDRVVLSPGISCGVCERCLSGEDNLCPRYAILGEHVSGGYSRHLVVPDANVLPYPGDLSFPEAAAVPLAFLTAWQMVVTKGRIRPGQTILIHAAGSGVSSAAIQIAKLFGARVIATVGSEAKAQHAISLGADHVINYAAKDFVAEVKWLTSRRGADLTLDHVGGDVMTKSVIATASGGRIVTCGATAGFSPTIDLRHVFFRQIEILGSTMGSKGSLFPILEHVKSGRLRPVIDRVLSLWDAQEAHRALEAREVFGKIVLEVN